MVGYVDRDLCKRFSATEMPSPPTSCTNIQVGLTTTKGKIYRLAYLMEQHNSPDTSRNFTQLYSTKSERDRNMRKEYERQMEYRKQLQAFIDRWRYNAISGMNKSQAS